MPVSENPTFVYQPFKDAAGRTQRPWWVKTVDTPTVEIDWTKMQRFNERYDPKTNIGSVRGAGFAGYVGKAKNDELTAQNTKVLSDGVKNNTPGYTLKDQALNCVPIYKCRPEFLGSTKGTDPGSMGSAQVDRHP